MKTYITAEIGVNHRGNPGAARELMDAAKIAGADAVKFQLWHERRFPDLSHLRLSENVLLETMAYAEAANLDWYCTPFDLYSIGWLAHMGMTQWKVPSGMITNYRYLNAIDGARKPGSPVHLSSGGSTMDELETALSILRRGPVIPYHCVTAYPSPITQSNLAVVRRWRYRWEQVGFSDHSGRWHMPLVAVCCGATHLEVHMTLDTSQDGPDHAASLSPADFAKMVDGVRELEVVLGSGVKKPAECEGNIEEIRGRMKL